MADVTATFAAKDQGVAAMIQRLENKLAGFQTRMGSVSASARKMQASFSSLGRSVVGLAGAYVGLSTAISSFNRALEMGGRLNELSQSTGESAGNLAVLERAFENAGVGGEKVGPMLGKMSNFIGDLSKGSETAAAVAKRLGISLADLRGKTPTQQLQILLQAIARVADETTRMDMSGEVFGNRMGYKLIPLANNFAAEIANARGELGSLVDILDKNAASLDELGDKLTNSVGNKLTELAIGFIAGVQGANDLANALSKIDAAGAGMKLGQIFSGAMKSPGQAFLAFGELLLLGIKKAGNALINAIVYAGKVWASLLTNPSFYKIVGQALIASMNIAASFFKKSVLTILEFAFDLLKKIPGMSILDPGDQISKGIAMAKDGLTREFWQAGQALNQQLTKGAELMSEAAASVDRTSVDYLGVEGQQAEVDAAFGALSELGKATEEATKESKGSVSDYFATLNDIYKKERAAIEAMDISQQDKSERIDKLGQQWNEARNKAFAPGFVPPSQQMQDAAMPASDRQDAAAVASGKPPASEEKKVASETTLQKVEQWLAELNTKLPAPVLV